MILYKLANKIIIIPWRDKSRTSERKIGSGFPFIQRFYLPQDVSRDMYFSDMFSFANELLVIKVRFLSATAQNEKNVVTRTLSLLILLFTHLCFFIRVIFFFFFLPHVYESLHIGHDRTSSKEVLRF